MFYSRKRLDNTGTSHTEHPTSQASGAPRRVFQLRRYVRHFSVCELTTTFTLRRPKRTSPLIIRRRTKNGDWQNHRGRSTVVDARGSSPGRERAKDRFSVLWSQHLGRLASKLRFRFYRIILKLGNSTLTCMVYRKLGQFSLEVQAKKKKKKDVEYLVYTSDNKL